jgi:hypothetical protein
MRAQTTRCAVARSIECNHREPCAREMLNECRQPACARAPSMHDHYSRARGWPLEQLHVERTVAETHTLRSSQHLLRRSLGAASPRCHEECQSKRSGELRARVGRRLIESAQQFASGVRHAGYRCRLGHRKLQPRRGIAKVRRHSLREAKHVPDISREPARIASARLTWSNERCLRLAVARAVSRAPIWSRRFSAQAHPPRALYMYW